MLKVKYFFKAGLVNVFHKHFLSYLLKLSLNYDSDQMKCSENKLKMLSVAVARPTYACDFCHLS